MAIGGAEDAGVGIGIVLVAAAIFTLCVAAVPAAPKSSPFTDTLGPTLDPAEPNRSCALLFGGLVVSPRLPSLARLA